MSSMKKVLSLFMCAAIAVCFSGCNFPFGEKTSTEEKPDTSYQVNTSVSYSSGSDSNWSYGNQRKEFPRDETCYVRIGSTVIAEKSKGAGTEITVTYKFTGTQNCKIELSDGIAAKSESSDQNVEIFTRTISAEKEKRATESVVIFQYKPSSNANSVALEVTYDEHIAARYDVRNTIYFSTTKANE